LPAQPGPSTHDQASELTGLFERLLQAWNDRNASEFASIFAGNGNMVGFDGSQANGREEIASHIGQVFRDHETAKYVWKVREVRLLSPETALLRAVVGMIPPGKSDINQATNAIQSLVAERRDDLLRIALLQSTPAQFHGRPEEAEALTMELRELVK
jgi:uncharacterized protein (TIGR02246 family)